MQGQTGGGAARAESAEACEMVVAQLLHDGYLQLDFGFTAYSTNCYLKCTPRASLLLEGLPSPLWVTYVPFPPTALGSQSQSAKLRHQMMPLTRQQRVCNLSVFYSFALCELSYHFGSYQ